MTQTDNLHEAELRELLDRTMSGATAPALLAAHSLHQGQKMRSRRRVGIAAGTVAAGAVAALVLPMTLSAGPTSGRIQPGGAPSPSTSTPSVSPPTAPPAAWWDQSANDMTSTIRAIKPDGVLVTFSGPVTFSPKGGGPSSDLTEGYIAPRLDTATGRGRLHLLLRPIPDERTASPELVGTGKDSITFGVGTLSSAISCDIELGAQTICTPIRDDLGTIIGRRLVQRSGETVVNHVVLHRSDGIISAAAMNTLDTTWGPDSPASSELPPLTLDQLEDIVRNDTWVMPAT